jgi:hypothetical protein
MRGTPVIIADMTMFNGIRAAARRRAQVAGRVAILSVISAIVAAKGCVGDGASPSPDAGSSTPVSTLQPVSRAVSAGAAVKPSGTANGAGPPRA